MSKKVTNFEIERLQFEKRPVEDIINNAEKIDTKRVAVEVLNWIIANVENFIDNQNKIFKLDLIIDNAEAMMETKKLQDLYRAIDDDNEKELDNATKCRKLLDGVTLDAFNAIKNEKDLLKYLFDRMIFYYEKVIPTPENKQRAQAIDGDLRRLFMQKEECASDEDKNKIQEQIVEKIKEGERLVKFTEYEGNVSVVNFEYEAFDVNVRVPKGEGDTDSDEEKEIVKQYVVPEGFAVWIEIGYRHKMRPVGMF